MPAEAVRVVLRCRPFSEKEMAAGHTNICNIDKSRATVTINDDKSQDPPKVFTFDSVFDHTCTQMEVYNTTARQVSFISLIDN